MSLSSGSLHRLARAGSCTYNQWVYASPVSAAADGPCHDPRRGFRWDLRAGNARGRMGQIDRAAHALSPRFSGEQRTTLQSCYGLTAAQVMWLERDLGVILDLLGPHVPMDDVRSELLAMQRDLASAAERVERWKRAVRPSHLSEAVGHLDIAGTSLNWHGDGNGSLPLQVIASDLIAGLARIASIAVENGPQVQRSGRPASSRAIEWIVGRLEQPTDDASVQARRALRDTKELTLKSGAPTLRGVCDIVFEAVFSSLNGHFMRDAGALPDSKRSVELYLQSRPNRRRRGRPPTKVA